MGTKDQAPPDFRTRTVRLIKLLAGCAVLGIGIQFVELINDNSTRNAISIIAAIVAYLGLMIWLGRWIATKSSRLVGVIAAIGLAMLPFVFFRLRGFSGEIIPQVEYRFASGRSLATPAASPSRPESASAQTQAPYQGLGFPQFLGPDRNGVIARREFETPQGAFPDPLWKIDIGDGWSGFAVENERCVTQEQRDDRECVSCYRISDGKLLWIHEETARHENSLGGIGPRATPTIHDGKVFAQGATGLVLCLDLKSGAPIWKRDLLEIVGWDQDASETQVTWGRSGSPLIVRDLCVLPLGGPDAGIAGREVDGVRLQGRGLIALEIATGKVRWANGSDQISYASPIVMRLDGVDQIVIVNEDSVSGHAIEDGNTLWSTPWSGMSNGSASCSAAAQVDANAFLVGKAYGEGSAAYEVRSAAGGFEVKVRWKKPSLLKTKFSHTAVLGDHAFALSDGTLECVELKEGKRVWAQPRGSRYGHGQTLLVDDVLVVQAEDGHVAIAAATTEGFEELATGEGLKSKSWNIPAIAGNYLLFRNDVEAIAYRFAPRAGETDQAETTSAVEAKP